MVGISGSFITAHNRDLLPRSQAFAIKYQQAMAHQPSKWRRPALQSPGEFSVHCIAAQERQQLQPGNSTQARRFCGSMLLSCTSNAGQA
eukprot:1159852-Pelagomonas_calceolata.AAC.7